MTSRWEPLKTVEEVVMAINSGRDVECSYFMDSGWLKARESANKQDAERWLSDAWRFRALIEDSK
jgi:hypothetical protein